VRSAELGRDRAFVRVAVDVLSSNEAEQRARRHQVENLQRVHTQRVFNSIVSNRTRSAFCDGTRRYVGQHLHHAEEKLCENQLEAYNDLIASIRHAYWYLCLSKKSTADKKCSKRDKAVQ